MTIHNPTLEFLAMTRIGEKGQLTVPTQFRKDLGLEAGAPFVVLRLGNGLMLLPEQERFQELCRRVSSKLTAAGLKPEEISVTLGKARDRVYARRYGKASATPRRTRIRRGK
jgi:AbrB family looped-hinge helix DNA binding protein